MRLNTEGPSTERPSGSVTVPIVFIGMPIGKVFSIHDVRRHEAPDATFFEQALDPSQPRVEPKLIGDKGHPLAAFDYIDQFLDAIQGIGQELLDEQVASCL